MRSSCLVSLREQVPYAGKHLRRDPDARISNAGGNLRALALDHQIDPPIRLGVFRRVGQEVYEHLFKPRGVRLDPDPLGCQRDDQADTSR
jgi:hypothetical protein